MISKLVKIILFCSLLTGGLASAKSSEDEKVCPRGYKGAYLEKGRKPKWGKAIKLCSERYLERAHELELRYIRMKNHEVMGPEVEVVLELISRQTNVIHILRNGYYYGEFIDDKRTKLGTRTRRLALMLKNVPSSPKGQRIDVETLEYFYTVGDYQWSKTHVTKVKRVTRKVRIDDKANLIPLGPKQYSVQYRRVVKFRIKKKPVPQRAKNREALVKLYEMPIFAQIHYHDPVLEKEVFFRRFNIKDDQKLSTVIPFVRKKGAPEPEGAIVYLYRGNKKINQFEMGDPKADDLELNLEVGLKYDRAY